MRNSNDILNDGVADNNPSLYAEVITTRPPKKDKRKKLKKKHKRRKQSSLCDYVKGDDEYYLFKNELNSLKRTGDNPPIELRVFPDSDVGIYIGNHGAFSYALLTSNEGHVCVIGSTGSGKSDCIVKHTIVKRSNPAFITDYKGELILLKTINPRKILYFTDEEGEDSVTFDLFDCLRSGGNRNVVSNARAIAEAIIPLLSETDKAFWTMAERDILTAAIVYYYDLKASFIDAMIAIKNSTTRELVSDILGSNNERAKMCITPCLADEKSGAEMLSGIEEGVGHHISIFASEEIIKRVFTPSEKTLGMSDLNTHDVFLRMPLERAKQWGAVTRLILTMQIQALMKRPDKHSNEGKQCRNVLLLLDEFPCIGKLEFIIDALETLRSKNVTIALFCQSLADLDDIYGANKRRRILDNCEFKVLLKTTDPETQVFFSDLVGTTETAIRGVSESYDCETGNTSYSRQVSEGRKRVMEPHEFLTSNKIVFVNRYTGFCLLEKDFYHLKNTPEQERVASKKHFSLPSSFWDSPKLTVRDSSSEGKPFALPTGYWNQN